VTKEPLLRAHIDESGKLVVTPSASASSYDFDFFVGRWNVRNRRLACRLAGCTEWKEYEGTDHVRSILNGIGLTNNSRSIVDGERFDGVGLKLFDPKTRLWSIYWADSRTGVLDEDHPVVGSFDGNIGTFYAQDTLRGKPILVMARWDKSDPDDVVWSQAFSEDGGRTWEWNWYMYEKRAPENATDIVDRLLTIDETIPIPPVEFDADGNLVVTASKMSSKHDFGFLAGEWRMEHRKLASRLNNSTTWARLQSSAVNFGPTLNGLGNTDLLRGFFGGKPFEGFTLRLFNPETRLWSLHWVPSDSGLLDPPVVGSFDGDIGHFFGKDEFQGKEVIVLFRWDFRDRDHPVWSQAFSPDRGQTWEWNWINVSYRDTQS
jgi:hypothetical protein